MRHLALVIVGCSSLWLAGCVGTPDDIGSATYNVCCGANCCCPSIGGGGAIRAGDRNPANACEICDPTRTASAWSSDPACSDAGGGMPPTDAGGGGGGGGGGGCAVTPAPAGGALALFAGLAAVLLGRRRR
ncbi:MAG: hypothetical protein KF729_16275 [Sandaracinaceae bacterium]|nr:hypothetical protein [Sandaracinaceae bacterium]